MDPKQCVLGITDKVMQDMHTSEADPQAYPNSSKYEKEWGGWLATPGLAPVDLVMDRLLL